VGQVEQRLRLARAVSGLRRPYGQQAARAFERGIEQEAEKQGALAERNRNRFNEFMTLGYVRAMECLEDEDWVSRNLRSSEVLNITRLHLDAVKAFEAEREPRDEDDWTEEDEAAIAEIVKEIGELESPEESTDEANAEEGDEGQN
jgi:hypothetical protein